MKLEETILIGVKNSVAAVSKANGAILWTTKLSGGMGGDFVTVTCDGEHVFAHSNGQLYALDLADGRVRWANELRGCGYGLASICIPGMSNAPEPAAVRMIESQRQAANSGAGAVA
jgi:outer membrane protein assembly factor BamB